MPQVAAGAMGGAAQPREARLAGKLRVPGQKRLERKAAAGIHGGAVAASPGGGKGSGGNLAGRGGRVDPPRSYGGRGGRGRPAAAGAE